MVGSNEDQTGIYSKSSVKKLVCFLNISLDYRKSIKLNIMYLFICFRAPWSGCKKIEYIK